MSGTLKIKDLPAEARPREAFMRSAQPERDIPDASLLAILIRTGRKGHRGDEASPRSGRPCRHPARRPRRHRRRRRARVDPRVGTRERLGGIRLRKVWYNISINCTKGDRA